MRPSLVPILLKPRASGATASLSSVVGLTSGEDCTAAGYADYFVASVGAANDCRKNGVNRIGGPALVGSAARLTSGTGVPTDVTYTGTDGNNPGTFSIGSSGFWSVTTTGTDQVSVTIPLPDTASHTVKVACGAWDNPNGPGSTVTVRASLSGGGAGPTADVITTVGAGAIYKQITYTFNANGAGQNLVITLEATNRNTVWLLLNRITFQ